MVYLEWDTVRIARRKETEMWKIYFSPKYHSENCPSPDKWDLGLKINIFEDRVMGWFLKFAEKLSQDPDAGYAILSIVLSHFEMIDLYKTGTTKDIEDALKGKRPSEPSKSHFFAGVDSVADFAKWPSADLENMKKRLYEAFRCGIYHAGMTRPDVLVTEAPKVTNLYEFHGSTLIIKPRMLLSDVRHHFGAYLDGLRNGKLAAEFERRFNWEVFGKEII
jgi:hypothetical protein